MLLCPSKVLGARFNNRRRIAPLLAPPRSESLWTSTRTSARAESMMLFISQWRNLINAACHKLIGPGRDKGWLPSLH